MPLSHYYSQGATRIDRQYYWGDVSVSKSLYVPAAFSDHFGLLTEVTVPFKVSRQNSGGGCSRFKIKNEVACDHIFKASVATEMQKWKELRDSDLDILTWWELLVKPGIKRLAIDRAREIRYEKRGELNMLMIRQAYTVKKLKASSCVQLLTELKYIQSHLCN